MSGRKAKPDAQVAKERIRQLCAEVTAGKTAFTGLSIKDFEPFLQAEDIRLRESPPLSGTAAPVWVKQTVAELAAEAGSVVAHFLLLVRSSEQCPRLETVEAVGNAAEGVIERWPAVYVLGVGVTKGLKEGEVTLTALAAVTEKEEER